MFNFTVQKSMEAHEMQLQAQPALLFIENTDKHIESYHNFFTDSFFTSCFDEAKMLLKKLDIFNQMPEMIVIDLPLQSEELSAFRRWMQSTFSVYVPVVYNADGLDKTTIKQLFKNKWVDDVVQLSSHFEKLPEKARFLKKIHSAGTEKVQAPKQRKHPVRRYSFLHRAFDVTLALIAILICLPVFILIAIAIKLESRGPIFYNALRAGKGYRVFRFYKFRTMEVNADKKVKELAALNQYGAAAEGPTFFKVKNDPRITKVGAFLRNTSLDELPQLFNVLKGDMSFVGNRPLPLYEAISLTTDEWAERFMAPAGITGLWQISRRGKEEMSPTERISLDIDYARNRTLSGDLKILLKTPTVLIQKANV